MKTPIPYYGGKQEMVKDILPFIPEHHVYCEPFAGGASVFFGKKLANLNILNDINGHVVNFWKVYQTDFRKLNRMIQTTPYSRELKKETWNILSSNNHNDLQKAWAFFYTIITSFSNTMSAGFPVAKTSDRSSKLLQLKSKKKFFRIGKYLIDNATIECLDFEKCIEKYDSDIVLFYIDPPYINVNQGHYKGWTEKNLRNLLDILDNIQGKFILSEFKNDIVIHWAEKCGLVIKEFKKVARAQSVQKHGNKIASNGHKYKTELLIMNYNPPGQKRLDL